MARGLGVGEEWKPQYDIVEIGISKYKKIKDYLNNDKELKKINERKYSAYFLDENNSLKSPEMILMELSHGGPFFGILAINKDFSKREQIKKDLTKLID